MSERRIPLQRLRTIRAQLDQVLADLESYGVGSAFLNEHSQWSSCDVETVRNLYTARAEIDGWITCRVATGNNPTESAKLHLAELEQRSRP